MKYIFCGMKLLIHSDLSVKLSFSDYHCVCRSW